jgi:multidrug efflux pump subunit AcrA (membrane-fusion protein)
MSTPVLAGRPEPDVSSQQKLTQQELDQARLFLQQTQSALVGATKGLSEAQWKFKPAPDRWSVAENLDHIVLVQERVLGPILDQLANAPAPAADHDYVHVDAIVIHQFSTRLNKFPAPEFIHPIDQIAPGELLNRLSANYARLAERLVSTPGLRQHALEAPPLKAVSKGAFELMDGYQWILAAAAHTERHTKQMLEVMADPAYPE